MTERKMRKEKRERERKESLKEKVRAICWSVCVCVLQIALWHCKHLLVLSRAELEACSKPFTFTARLARFIEHGWHSTMFITQRHDQRALLSGCTTFIWVPTADSSIRRGLSSTFSPPLMVSLSFSCLFPLVYPPSSLHINQCR